MAAASPRPASAEDLHGITRNPRRYASLQKVPTDAALGACFFEGADGRVYLAVASYGDKQEQDFRRNSPVYELDPDASPPLRLVQELATRGANNFFGFDVDGRTFLVVANSQDDNRGSHLQSTVWRLADAG